MVNFTAGKRGDSGVDLTIDCGSAIEKIEGFIKDRIASAGRECGIVGLSGGVDSTVTAYLCCKALGREKVWGIILPCGVGRPDSLAHARSVVEELGIQSSTIDITEALDVCVSLCPHLDRVRKGNIIARLRMIVLYDQAHLRNGLVIGTTNKTELLLGYLTKYGDGGVDIEPLVGLYKTQVWQLAAHLGILKDIVHKPPTADLWTGQTDEGELGFTYGEVDRLLHAMYEEGLRGEDLQAKGFSPEFIETVRARISSSEHKRRRVPVAEL